MEAASAEWIATRALDEINQSLGTVSMTNRRSHPLTQLPPPSSTRLAASLSETAHDLNERVTQVKSDHETVLYLAYGSNLSKETFRGKRGIQPIAQVNVQVPSLRMTFDLPGIPYTEPCFANTARRDPKDDPSDQVDGFHASSEKSPLLEREEYRKDKWHKGLIGVVYEITPEDYAHLINTEGGGASYQDILVDCHPFASQDPTQQVPQAPSLPPFKAHTLFAPAQPPDEPPPEDGGRFQRPDTSYAQASARYLKLITDGAAELGLPYEYQEYVQSLRPYTITTCKQRLGQVTLLALWAPFIAIVFALGKIFADDKGRIPGWLRQITGAIFRAVWNSYDRFFKSAFGDGERTLSDGEDIARSRGTRNLTHLTGRVPSLEFEKVSLVA